MVETIKKAAKKQPALFVTSTKEACLASDATTVVHDTVRLGTAIRISWASSSVLVSIARKVIQVEAIQPLSLVQRKYQSN